MRLIRNLYFLFKLKQNWFSSEYSSIIRQTSTSVSIIHDIVDDAKR